MVFLLIRVWCIVVLVGLSVALWAAANGSLSGTLVDPSGAVVPGAKITLVNTALNSEYKAISNGRGFYSFPTLPVGHYDVAIEAAGFKTQKKTNLTIDTDAALRLDMVLAAVSYTHLDVYKRQDLCRAGPGGTPARRGIGRPS